MEREDKIKDALKKSNEINMSSYMHAQFKEIMDRLDEQARKFDEQGLKIDNQGSKVDRMYNWLINDPETGSLGLIKIVHSNSSRISELEIFNLIIKKQALFVSTICSFVVSIVMAVVIFIITKNL